MKFDKFILLPIVGAIAGFIGFTFGTNQLLRILNFVLGTGNLLSVLGYIAFRLGEREEKRR